MSRDVLDMSELLAYGPTPPVVTPANLPQQLLDELIRAYGGKTPPPEDQWMYQALNSLSAELSAEPTSHAFREAAKRLASSGGIIITPSRATSRLGLSHLAARNLLDSHVNFRGVTS